MFKNTHTLKLLFNVNLRRFMSSKSNPTVAVILSGSGVYDGSEIHEASAVMVSLSRNDALYKVFAPDIQQMHVVNHTNGEEMKETRNVLVESARVARGNIEALEKLNVSDYDAVIFPGGFGAAKNLSDFAIKHADCTVNPSITKVIKEFHSAKKPIGMCCIAPVIAAKVLPGCEVTVGMDSEQGGRFPYAGAASAVVAMESTHVNKEVHEYHVDEINRLVTTPAFMCETKVHEVHDGIAAMVKAVLQMIL